MAKYAVIIDNKVSNIVESDSALEKNWVLVNGVVDIGTSYTDGAFVTQSPTKDQIIDSMSEQFNIVVQEKLDSFAKERGYDNMSSLSSYATSSVDSFKQEGLRGIELRDSSWSVFIDYIAKVRSGEINYQDGISKLEELLPDLTWT
tara:strand:+ start:6121 stop:6558 length:438 start_codon:yes stop_codon:yes gene_type:complete